MRSSIIYQPKRDWKELPEDIKLRQWEWRVLLEFNGNQTIGQAIQQSGLKREEMAALLQKFHGLDLLVERELSFAEFVSAETLHPDGDGDLPELPAPARVFTPAALPPPSSSAPGSHFIPLPTLKNTAALPAITQGRKMNLKAVMNFITNHVGGDANAGQLAVYRVFMRVDTKLLKRNGITSLRFQEDRIVSDPELEEAVLGSTRIALGVGCPDDVFVRE